MLFSIIAWATSEPLITVFDQSPKVPFHWVVILKRVALASIAGSALFLAQGLIIQLIAINYHRRQFEDRVNESKLKVAQTDALYDTSLALFPENHPAFRNEDFSIRTGMDFSKSASSNQKLIGNLAMFGETLQSTVGNITGEIMSSRAKETKAAAIHNVVVEALEQQVSTEALAKRIWFSLVSEGKDALTKEDIQTIMGPQREAQANDIFDRLDVDENGDVSLEEMVMWLAEVAREKKYINRSMHDVGEAVKVRISCPAWEYIKHYAKVEQGSRSLHEICRTHSSRHHLRLVLRCRIRQICSQHRIFHRRCIFRHRHYRSGILGLLYICLRKTPLRCR